MEQQTNDMSAILAELQDIKRAVLLAQKDTLNISDCALYTGYAVQTLYSMVCRKEIPYYKRGRSVFFDKGDIEKWMRGMRIASNEEIEERAEAYIESRNKYAS